MSFLFPLAPDYLLRFEANQKKIAAYEALSVMYDSAEAKNPAGFQEKFYALPKEFRERIKTRNLELDSNDTEARLSHCATVIEALAKEEFDHLSPSLKEGVSFMVDSYVIVDEVKEQSKDKTFKTDEERLEELFKVPKKPDPKDKTRNLLRALADILKSPYRDLDRRALLFPEKFLDDKS